MLPLAAAIVIAPSAFVIVTLLPCVRVATAGPLVPPISSCPLVDIAAAATVSVPESCVINTALSAKDVAFVPPLLTGTVSLRVEPAAVTVIAAEPSKSTPLIALAVANAVAVAALPVQEPEDPEAFPVKLPVTLPVTSPVRLPVTSPVKLPVTSPVTFPVNVPAIVPVPVIVGDVNDLLF